MADRDPDRIILALRPGACARALGVDERTLRRWQREEGLPVARVGGAVLYPVEELRKWLAERVVARREAEAIADEILRDL